MENSVVVCVAVVVVISHCPFGGATPYPPQFPHLLEETPGELKASRRILKPPIFPEWGPGPIGFGFFSSAIFCKKLLKEAGLPMHYNYYPGFGGRSCLGPYVLPYTTTTTTTTTPAPPPTTTTPAGPSPDDYDYFFYEEDEEEEEGTPIKSTYTKGKG